MKLHRVRYGHTYFQPDVPKHVWHFMNTCVAETDPERRHHFNYITDEYWEAHRHYYERIVGWEWDWWCHPLGSEPKRMVIYALLDCPITACLWRIEMPRRGNEPLYELEFESCSTAS